MTDGTRIAAETHIDRIKELTGKTIEVVRVQNWPATHLQTIYFSNGQTLDRSYLWD